ncbi:hypothetical protein IM774_00220 [Erysipelotrichaceae bacterium RD49]|nr:hypothetical protein [Erysipelotrichaceae bacterium RD49]
MKHTSKLKALKSCQDTRWCKYIALALGCSIAGIVSYGIMQTTPTIVANDPASEQKIAVTVDEQPTPADDQPAKAVNTQPSQAVTMDQAAAQKESATPTLQVERTENASHPVFAAAADTVGQTPLPAVLASAESTSDENTIRPAEANSFVPFEEVDPNELLQQTAQVTTQPAPASPTYLSPIGSDGIWHVSYIPYWGAAAAPDDGSIGLWADGWFIAHSGMLNGDTIASIPSYVEVDGQVYAMTDTWISDDSVSTEEIARARANNGIVFQTCITDTTNRLVHYEPVDGPGYPYQFTNYPYTQSDVQIMGLQ